MHGAQATGAHEIRDSRHCGARLRLGIGLGWRDEEAVILGVRGIRRRWNGTSAAYSVSFGGEKRKKKMRWREGSELSFPTWPATSLSLCWSTEYRKGKSSEFS
jgi:hypothetical protein